MTRHVLNDAKVNDGESPMPSPTLPKPLHFPIFSSPPKDGSAIATNARNEDKENANERTPVSRKIRCGFIPSPGSSPASASPACAPAADTSPSKLRGKKLSALAFDVAPDGGEASAEELQSLTGSDQVQELKRDDTGPPLEPLQD
jgi:hypothetical protein